MTEKKAILLDTVKRHRSAAAIYLLSAVLCCGVFALYALPVEPFVYTFILLGAVGLVLFAAAYSNAMKKAKERERMLLSMRGGELYLTSADTLAEKDLETVCLALREELTRLRTEYETRCQDEKDYYTSWVHQIKTPVAVLRLELGTEDSPRQKRMENELFRIEQYADMILQYIRLGSESNDLVIRPCPLDEMIREAVRKYAPRFVARRLKLSFEDTGLQVITDAKWFSCMLEQLLSNAVKYTPSGGVTIVLEEESLIVRDTGIGIAAEDLPRIFEMGYTGQNGRQERHSSGLGLYLFKKAADLLAIPVAVESTVGKGSSFRMDLKGRLARTEEENSTGRNTDGQ